MKATRASFVSVVVLCGCASNTEVTPVIPISKGYAERIAIMDHYRLHDEDRKRMMRRPRVWVEEVPDDPTPEPMDAAGEGCNEGDASCRPEGSSEDRSDAAK